MCTTTMAEDIKEKQFSHTHFWKAELCNTYLLDIHLVNGNTVKSKDKSYSSQKTLVYWIFWHYVDYEIHPNYKL